ncbi:hypothetical protein I656_02579 [Geobacillus sp. WSUCF1]|nr:hypothetical protein I656_02579 [Geobacillus sp. WSUCF1]
MNDFVHRFSSLSFASLSIFSLYYTFLANKTGKAADHSAAFTSVDDHLYRCNLKL